VRRTQKGTAAYIRPAHPSIGFVKGENSATFQARHGLRRSSDGRKLGTRTPVGWDSGLLRRRQVCGISGTPAQSCQPASPDPSGVKYHMAAVCPSHTSFESLSFA
jgi:hypothetical protein